MTIFVNYNFMFIKKCTKLSKKFLSGIAYFFAKIKKMIMDL